MMYIHRRPNNDVENPSMTLVLINFSLFLVLFLYILKWGRAAHNPKDPQSLTPVYTYVRVCMYCDLTEGFRVENQWERK